MVPHCQNLMSKGCGHFFLLLLLITDYEGNALYNLYSSLFMAYLSQVWVLQAHREIKRRNIKLVMLYYFC